MAGKRQNAYFRKLLVVTTGLRSRRKQSIWPSHWLSVWMR
jgi:hypothetical protein